MTKLLYPLLLSIPLVCFSCKTEKVPPTISFIGENNGEKIEFVSPYVHPMISANFDAGYNELKTSMRNQFGFFHYGNSGLLIDLFFDEILTKDEILNLEGVDILYNSLTFPTVHISLSGDFGIERSESSDNTVDSYFIINSVTKVKSLEFDYKIYNTGNFYLLSGTCQFHAENQFVKGDFEIMVVEIKE